VIFVLLFRNLISKEKKMKLSIIKSQILATTNMLNEFSVLKRIKNIDSSYDTVELTQLRSSLKKALTALILQMRNHPDYTFNYDLVGTGEIQ
jgi:hypothetical protein